MMRGTAVRTVASRFLILTADLSGQVLRAVPAAGGILLTCYGMWLAWRPLGFIVGGLFLLLLDRKVP